VNALRRAAAPRAPCRGRGRGARGRRRRRRRPALNVRGRASKDSWLDRLDPPYFRPYTDAVRHPGTRELAMERFTTRNHALAPSAFMWMFAPQRGRKRDAR